MAEQPPKNRLAGLLAPRRMEVSRICKYGHGLLDKSSRSWALVNHLRSGEADPDGFHTGQLHFRCALWVCPVCGYIELSDTAS